MSDQKPLTMTFDPLVIEHLGVRMYSTLPPVLSELIANSYDADATEVNIELHDEDSNDKKIIVRDNGTGMSFNDIESKFLVIGRNCREHGETTIGGRKPIGKKGLGKLSFFGIVQTITVDTVRDRKRNIFKMDWETIMNSDGQYNVDHVVQNESTKLKNGTTITLEDIKRKSDFSSRDIANSISRFFIFDENFTVKIKHNKERKITVKNQMRFDSLDEEFKWNIPEDLEDKKLIGYLTKNQIRGEVITTIGPIRPNTKVRGVTLFSRGKLVQAPYYFSESTSSHFFSYLTGWLEIDFIDDMSEDVISTNRQSLNWENSEMSKLHSKLQDCIAFIGREWRKKRTEKKGAKIKGKLPKDWYGSIPDELMDKIEAFFTNLGGAFFDKENDLETALNNFLDIIPAYPYYHWRNLHKELTDSQFDMYRKREYLRAAQDAVNIYEKAVKQKSGLSNTGTTLYKKSFCWEERNLQINNPFRDNEDKKSVHNGQANLSKGLSQSFRNIIAHGRREEYSKFFTDKNCLDILSLVSFLLHRLDDAKKVDKCKKTAQKKKVARRNANSRRKKR